MSKLAGVAELADAHDSKSCGAIRAGSSPATGIRKRVFLMKVKDTLFWCIEIIGYYML